MLDVIQVKGVSVGEEEMVRILKVAVYRMFEDEANITISIKFNFSWHSLPGLLVKSFLAGYQFLIFYI